MRLVALTVITSLADGDLSEIGLLPSVKDQVVRLAVLAGAAGCHGVVASAREAEYLRRMLPARSLIVCPGIQLADSGATDQVRVATPAMAARSGATHVVIGRAITLAADPLAAYRAALAGFRDGL